VTRGEATRAAAGIVGRWVPDIGGLCLILDEAGLGRLSAAVRAAGGGKKRATPRARAAPDAAVWYRQADRVIGR
jgi:hypothetical protein